MICTSSQRVNISSPICVFVRPKVPSSNFSSKSSGIFSLPATGNTSSVIFSSSPAIFNISQYSVFCSKVISFAETFSKQLSACFVKPCSFNSLPSCKYSSGVIDAPPHSFTCINASYASYPLPDFKSSVIFVLYASALSGARRIACSIVSSAFSYNSCVI